MLVNLSFYVTQMMPPSFVVCVQNFRVLSLLRCPSPKNFKSSLAGRKWPSEQPNGHFPEKQKCSKFTQDMGVICYHRIGSAWTQKWGYIRCCLKEQLISGP